MAAITAQDVIKVALTFEGVKESPANSNNVQFNTHFYGREVSGSSYPWCAVFLWDVFRLAGASDLYYGGAKTAYTPTLANYYKNKNAWFVSPQVGDIVFFQFNGSNRINHVGLVIEVLGNGKIKTIEGNTSAGNDANGGQVQVRERSSYIKGYGRPNYANSTSTAYTQKDFIKDVQAALGVTVDGIAGAKTLAATITLSKVKNKNHEVVYYVQKYLNTLGCNCGTPDGSFGGQTYAGVCAYQKAYMTTPDGVISASGKTWKKLLGMDTSASTTTPTSSEPTSTKYTQKQFIKDIQGAIGVTVDGSVGPNTLGALVTVSQKTNKKHKVVIYIQKYLNELGYDCGTPDGCFGPKTYNAVCAYQKTFLKNPDGIISKNGTTWKKLLGKA